MNGVLSCADSWVNKIIREIGWSYTHDGTKRIFSVHIMGKFAYLLTL